MRRGLGLVVVFAVAGVFAWAIVSKRKRTAVNDPKLNAWLQRPGTTPDPATLPTEIVKRLTGRTSTI